MRDTFLRRDGDTCGLDPGGLRVHRRENNPRHSDWGRLAVKRDKITFRDFHPIAAKKNKTPAIIPRVQTRSGGRAFL